MPKSVNCRVSRQAHRLMRRHKELWKYKSANRRSGILAVPLRTRRVEEGQKSIKCQLPNYAIRDQIVLVLKFPCPLDRVNSKLVSCAQELVRLEPCPSTSTVNCMHV